MPYPQKNDDVDDDFLSEIQSTEHILSNDYYLHTCIMDGIRAFPKAIKMENPKMGFITLQMVVYFAKMIAEAKGLIDYQDPEYTKRREAYKKQIDFDKIADEDIRNTQLARFDLGEILKVLEEHKVKHGKLII